MTLNLKTMFVAAFSFLAIANISHGQGYIGFLNTSNSLVLTLGPAGTLVPADLTSSSGIKIQLLYRPDNGGPAPAAASFYDLAGWELLGSPANIAPEPGRFGAYSEVTGTDVAPAGNVWLEVIGWNGGYTSYSAAVNGSPSAVGASGIWSQGTGNGTTLPPVFTTAFFPGLEIVPEPATITLGGLGVATLLLLRRRK